MDVGRRLSALRVAKGFNSQAGLARASGVSQGMISEIESGARDPRLGTLEKLAAALGMSLGEFFAANVENHADLTWFWQVRLSALDPREVDNLKESTTRRVAWSVKQLIDAFGAEQIGSFVGQPIDVLKSIAAEEVDATPAIQDLIAEHTKVSLNWLRYGELPPLDRDLQTILQHELAGGYLAATRRAIKLGIAPEWLERQIDLMGMYKQQ